MVGHRRRVILASALAATAGGAEWVILLLAGLSAAVATAAALVATVGLASLGAWRADRRLIGLALVYSFAFLLLESPVFIVLALLLSPSGGGG
jgi:hypothetical protein